MVGGRAETARAGMGRTNAAVCNGVADQLADTKEVLGLVVLLHELGWTNPCAIDRGGESGRK